MTALLRWLGLLLLATLLLQGYFVGRIALMMWVDPASTTFQRSEALRLGHGWPPARWQQHWVAYDRISDNLKRAVIASEDDGFSSHGGVDWGALRQAWRKNERRAASVRPGRNPKVVGGSTITQQLAKNLFLSGERTLMRKTQELALTLTLEALLDKRRILEIYLNSVEWGEGVFGAEAAAQRYYGKPAAQLSPLEAARLAAMLPRPKYFERMALTSPYLAERSAALTRRLSGVTLP